MSSRPAPHATPTDSPLFGQLFAPLEMRSAGELIAERVVTAIAMGVFVSGQRLPSERELASSLNVSRTTVREAISRLAATGYVEVRRGRHGGAVVTSEAGPEADMMIYRTLAPSWERLEQIFDFRTLIEPLIARTAAARRSETSVERIRKTLEAYRVADNDRAASGRADGELHRSIAEATENAYLVDLSDRIRHAVSLGFHAEPYSQAIREQAVIEHTALADAIIDGDPERAGEIAARHFGITEERLRALLARASEHGDLDGAAP